MPAPISYTTKIAATQTVSEMWTLLAQHGARRIAVEYDSAGVPGGLDFTLVTPHGPRGFSLTVDAERMHALLQEEDRAGRLKSGSKAERASRAQAERVAWRVLKHWLEAQLALVAAQLVDIDQALLPFLQIDAAGQTLYAAYKTHEAAALLKGDGQP